MQALPRQEVDDTVGAVGWRGDAFAQRVAGVDPADVAILTRMRIEATGTQHISEESTVILSEYAALLLEVAPRLEGYEADVRFEFCWCHAFNEAQSIASSSVYFELACVLWNVGSSYAALGLDEPRDSMEGLIAAQTHFEYAAGVLCCLKESVLPRIMGRSFPHFSEAGIQFAINLMLAQAQYANYLSLVHLLAIGEIDVPPATVASVASRVSYFYLRAYSYSLQIPFVKVLDPKWSNILKFCIKTTAGYAEFHQARSVMDLAQATGAGYGEVVARLMRALRLLKDASVMDAGSTLSIHEMECTVLQIIVQVEQTLVIAINDFDTSTDQSSVPGELELRPVDGVTVITIRNPLHDIVFATKRFSGVVSRYVTDLADHFKARVQSLVNTVVIEANQATNLASSLLSDIGLPGSLETFKQGGQLSDNLWGKIKKIQMLGGADNILRHQDAMNSKANDAIKAIDELRDCLEAEHHRDNAFRLTHPMWISTDTLPAIVDMTASCLEMRDMAYAARMSDGALTEDLHSASLTNALKVLAMPRHEVAALLPCGQSGAKPKMNKWSMWSFNILEGALNHIDDLLLARSKMVGHLLGRAEADFTDDLKDCLADGLTGEEAEDKLFLVFQNLAKAISESTATQPSILDAVVHANMAFIEARDSDPDAIEMNRVVAQLEQCVCSYYKTLSQLMEGDSFYEGMQYMVSVQLHTLSDTLYTLELQRLDHDSEVTELEERAQAELSDLALAMQLDDEWKVDAKSHAQAPSTAPSMQPIQQKAPSVSVTASRPVSVSLSRVAVVPAPRPSIQMKAFAPSMPVAVRYQPPTPHEYHTLPRPADPQDRKVTRLVDMGFQRDVVMDTLAKCSYDEGAALNRLLGF